MSGIDLAVVQAFTPTGRLRASINLGNAVLAHRGAVGQPPFGVSVDLARAFGRRLGVEVDLVSFDKAAQSVEAVATGQADIGFFAIDPLRGQDIAFTEAYVLIEGAYLVRRDSPIVDNAQVDQPGIRLMTGKGSAYDLHLTREIRQASIVRTDSSQSVVDDFLAQGLDVAAGVRQQLEADVARVPGLRLLPGRFMVIRQAMGCAKSRGGAAAAALAAFVEDMKAEGFVADALQRHGIDGASVAPPAA